MTRFFSIVKIVATIGILCLVFFQVDWNRLVALFTTISIPYVALAFLLILGGTLISTLAEQQIMKAIHLNLTFWKILKTNYSSFFYSFLHEFVGAVVRFRQFSGDDKRRGEAVFIMGYEKFQMLLLLFLFSLFGYLFVAGNWLTNTERNVMNSLYLVLGSLFAAILSLLFYKRLGDMIEKFLRRLDRTFYHRILVEKCLDIIRIVKQLQARPHRYLAAFCIYGVGVGMGVLVYFLLFKALHISLAPAALVWTVSFAILAQSLPFTIYGLGLREGALIFCLSKFSINSEIGVTVGVLVFFLSIMPGLIFGVLSALSFFSFKKNEVTKYR